MAYSPLRASRPKPLTDKAMMPNQPKDHPTFKRAIGLAHKRLLAQREKISERVAELLSDGSMNPQSAANVAMAEIAQKAFGEAIESLSQECSRRVRVEYVIDGAAFLDEACERMLSKGGELSPLIASALALARPCMPGQVAIELDFGLREDGLVFGSATHRAIGGSFQSLRDCVRETLSAALPASEPTRPVSDEERDEWSGLDELPEVGPPSLSLDMRPALMAIVEQSLPAPEGSNEARPLSATTADLRARLESLASIDFQADAESLHTLTGLQAIVRIESISAEAGKDRPNAADFSRFMIELGF